MKLREDCGTTEADLRADEVALFSNILNEICNGFTVPNFESTIGATEDQVRSLFERIQTLEPNKPMRIQFVSQEWLVLQNALRETLRELGVEEFSIRTGVPFETGQAVLSELQAWNSR